MKAGSEALLRKLQDATKEAQGTAPAIFAVLNVLAAAIVIGTVDELAEDCKAWLRQETS